MNPIIEQNRRAWDERVRKRQRHTGTATDKDFADPLRALDDCGWFEGPLAGKSVLCLGAGGGKHGPLCAAAGAKVTVVDISSDMLALDQKLAAERGLQLRTIEASMDDLAMLGDSIFDLVLQPVSTCYVPKIVAVYEEVARVTKPGGLYISQHKQPAALQAEAAPTLAGYLVNEPYERDTPLPPAPESSLHREPGTIEFLHTLESIMGGLCRSGFVIEDLIEPRNGDPAAAPGTFAHRSLYFPPFVTMKARRKNEPRPAKIWLPK